MKAYLMKKRVWGIVKGVDVKPAPGASDLREWLKDEQHAAGTIYLGLEDGQKSHVDEFQDDPVKMWTELLNCDSASLVLSCGYGTASSCITILCIIGIVHSLDAQQLTHGGTTAQQVTH